jgi:hypothetical protein
LAISLIRAESIASQTSSNFDPDCPKLEIELEKINAEAAPGTRPTIPVPVPWPLPGVMPTSVVVNDFPTTDI